MLLLLLSGDSEDQNILLPSSAGVVKHEQAGLAESTPNSTLPLLQPCGPLPVLLALWRAVTSKHTQVDMCSQAHAAHRAIAIICWPTLRWHHAGAACAFQTLIWTWGLRLLTFCAGSFSTVFLVYSCILADLFGSRKDCVSCPAFHRLSPAGQSALPVGSMGSLPDMSSRLCYTLQDGSHQQLTR